MKSSIALLSALLLAAAAGYLMTGSQQAYSVDYMTNSTFTSGNFSPVENPSVYNRQVNFTGAIEVDDSCTEVRKTQEEKGNELVVKVDTYSNGEECEKSSKTLYQRYRMEVTSSQPFRLKLLHKGREVREFRTPNYEP